VDYRDKDHRQREFADFDRAYAWFLDQWGDILEPRKKRKPRKPPKSYTLSKQEKRALKQARRKSALCPDPDGWCRA